ncbi:GNAT family N-acetyltransferase [Futiania mangrovi]|uniref:GNAT family N-acetyltransferase n=1 Tax=Futiania mangrovi TaxID=2959716 RepID=A0A9J6PG25_9PROT|nr:GNAT family N-acetyltransferase [Futiania mangrovii]MCP1336755.1 GNAT family N-acetyltransferase [Futiania mangrovii]
MASSEVPPIEALSAGDMADLLALSADASWNQVAADWQVFLDRGAVWGVREEGTVVASAALLPYRPATAWVSMVLTLKRARGSGHASRLLAHAVAASLARGLPPQLDATPEGLPIYRRQGFKARFEITRWKRPGEVRPCPPPALPDPAVLERAAALDARALGVARPEVLAHLAARGPHALAADGFALSRDGRAAHHIGPVVAADPARAQSLFRKVLAQIGEGAAVSVDARDAAPGFAVMLEGLGFQRLRPFTRMALGAAPAGTPDLIAAIAGPELA